MFIVREQVETGRRVIRREHFRGDLDDFVHAAGRAFHDEETAVVPDGARDVPVRPPQQCHGLVRSFHLAAPDIAVSGLDKALATNRNARIGIQTGS